jgi:hypothetical protein
MERLFLWPPLLWSVRVLLLLYAAGVAYVSALFLARFLRPGNAWALMSGGLPRIGRVEGTAKVLGQEVTLNAQVNDGEAQRLANVERMVTDLHLSLREWLERNSAVDPAPGGSHDRRSEQPRRGNA